MSSYWLELSIQSRDHGSWPKPNTFHPLSGSSIALEGEDTVADCRDSTDRRVGARW